MFIKDVLKHGFAWGQNIAKKGQEFILHREMG